MRKTNLNPKHTAAAFLCGALFFSGLSYAATSTQLIEVSFDKLKIYADQKDQSHSNGRYDNGGTAVPESLIYQGTTYIPLRMAADLLDSKVYWDGQNKAISIGQPYIPLVNSSGESIGFALLSEKDGGVDLHIEAAGLTPGLHGFHVHEKAFSGSSFKDAGGHFNPDGKKHGHHSADGHHAGDLPNLEVKADGTVQADLHLEHASLTKGHKYSLLGRSLIIHAKADDGKTDPAGDSGDRIAGGVIPE